MSVEAMSWALNDADVSDPLELLVLLGMSNHAGRDGSGVRAGQNTLAFYARCSLRTVQRKLAELERRGLIRRGDQSLAEHIPHYARPVVWDLAMTPRQSDAPTPRHHDATVTAVTRPSRHSYDANPTSRMADKPSEEPSDEPSELTTSLAEAFEAFWAVYPRKQDKRDARKAWDKITTGKDAVNPGHIIDGAARYAADPNRSPEFTKLPATWLNKGGWESDPLPARHGHDRAAGILAGELETARRVDAAERATLFALPGGQP